MKLVISLFGFEAFRGLVQKMKLSIFSMVNNYFWTINEFILSKTLLFFSDCNVKNGTEGVHFVHAHDSGKPSGEAFIELETDADVDKAKKHTMGYIGTR